MYRLSALLLAALPLLPLAPASGAADPIDWVLAEVAMPAETDQYDIWFGVQGEGPHGPLIVGRGYQLGEWYRDVEVSSYEGAQGGTTGERYVASVGPVTRTLEITRPTAGGFGVGAALGVHGHAMPGETIRFLLFVPGARVTGWFAELEVDGVSYPATVTTGSGSGVVRVAEAGMGVGLETPPGALPLPAHSFGLNTLAREVPAGAIGALQIFHCAEGTECESSWSSPDGRSASVEHTRGPHWAGASGESVFTGPAGAWTFSWEGFSDSGIVAAYAPVGEAWRDW